MPAQIRREPGAHHPACAAPPPGARPISDAHRAPTRFYHNPRCSKSRGALELLRERGIEPALIAYLESPPDAAELRELLGLLGIGARALLRSGEDEYKQLGLDDAALGDEALIAAMAAHPRLIERPLFVHGGRAAIGRPPERVLALL